MNNHKMSDAPIVSSFECDDIFECLACMEAALDQKYKEHDALVKSSPTANDTNDDDGELAVEGYYRYSGSLPSVMRASVFVYAYGRLEYSIHALCERLQAACGTKCGPKDLKDRGLTRSRNYLDKVIGIEWENSERDTLNTISIYGTIRNAIAHNNGILKPERDADAYIRQAKGIVLNEDRLLWVESEFVFRAIQDMKRAWDLVYERTIQFVAAEGQPKTMTCLSESNEVQIA